jgi:hypothetical protein
MKNSVYRVKTQKDCYIYTSEVTPRMHIPDMDISSEYGKYNTSDPNKSSSSFKHI